mmetsp:Transcript_17658/g.57286  ORF Transcript_17658/g.57286 Transcript_17658/m.57286 type:complete len:259 (-) Transcript_17658:930-1706(-)
MPSLTQGRHARSAWGSTSKRQCAQLTTWAPAAANGLLLVSTSRSTSGLYRFSDANARHLESLADPLIGHMAFACECSMILGEGKFCTMSLNLGSFAHVPRQGQVHGNHVPAMATASGAPCANCFGVQLLVQLFLERIPRPLASRSATDVFPPLPFLWRLGAGRRRLRAPLPALRAIFARVRSSAALAGDAVVEPRARAPEATTSRATAVQAKRLLIRLPRWIPRLQRDEALAAALVEPWVAFTCNMLILRLKFAKKSG